MSRSRRIGAAALVLALLASCEASEGPQPIAFDRERCAHCGMLISDPAFAAQLLTQDGEVASFDDPGCLLLALDAKPAVRARWFHHLREPRWVPGERVAFLRVPRSPMGSGLAAVEAGEAGALSLPEARALLAATRGREDAP